MFSKKMLMSILFALLVVAGTTQAGGDADAGKAIAANCAGCHGANGEGMDPNPPIAGIEEAEHVKMLKEYKDGTREDPMMQMFVGQLSEEDMANVAAYYATLEKN